MLVVPFPEGEWSVSGLVIQGSRAKASLPPREERKALPRPAIAHDAPVEAERCEAEVEWAHEMIVAVNTVSAAKCRS